jgi:hypothetical protein
VTELSTIPRTVVKTYLCGLRLPLRGLEAITGHRDDETWPPSLAFEGFEASAKVVIGSALGDPRLVDEGHIQQAKISELRRAAELETDAEQMRASADAQAKARVDQAAGRHDQADEEAEQRTRAAEARQRRAQQEAKRRQARRAEAVAKADAAREKRVARTERTTRSRTVEAESAALTRERRAVAAADKVATLDRAIQQKKATRKSS